MDLAVLPLGNVGSFHDVRLHNSVVLMEHVVHLKVLLLQIHAVPNQHVHQPIQDAKMGSVVHHVLNTMVVD
jgi:hypothetical protein